MSNSYKSLNGILGVQPKADIADEKKSIQRNDQPAPTLTPADLKGQTKTPEAVAEELLAMFQTPSNGSNPR